MRFVGMLIGLFMLQTCLVWANPVVLSFKDWKNEKISGVRQQYGQLESQYLIRKTANAQDKSLPSLYRQLKSSKAHLDELHDLNVTDYFIGYLSQFKDKKTIFDSAVAKLEPSEVAEVMGAYANSLLKTSGEGLSTAADNQKDASSK